MPAATMPEEINLSATLDVEAKAEAGKPPRFSLLANSGEPMRVAGFYEPVVIDLKGAEWNKKPTPVIQDHDTAKRIGHTTEQRIDGSGIYAEGIVSSSTDEAQAFVADAKAGFPFECSVGATVKESYRVEPGQSATVNGKTFKGPLIVAKKTGIRELSVTVLGADSKTSALVASKTKSTSGVNPNERKPIMPTTQTEIEAAVQNERERIKQIDAMLRPPTNRGWEGVQESVDNLRAEAIAGEIRLSDLPAKVTNLLQLQAIRNERPNIGSAFGYGPAIHVRGNHGDNAKVIECALANYVGVHNLDKTYGEATLEASKTLGVTSLMDVARLCATSEGKNIGGGSKEQIVSAAWSTSNFASLLSNVANKSLEEAYRAFPSSARRVARKLSANDFKIHTNVRITGDIVFLETPDGGDIKHANLGDSSYTYQIATYARMFTISRQSVINDDASGLDSVPRMLGRGAALAIEETFWTLVLANTGSFFHANNKNLITGGGSALGAAGLSSAVQKMLEQTDANGKPVNLTPRFLAVPPALKVTADELYSSRTFNAGGGSSEDRIPAANTFYGLMEPATSPWIGAQGGLAGASDTHWYLFGDPADVAAFGLAYLDGVEVPTIQQVEQAPNKLGMGFRGWIDFGVCQIDHRGAVRSAGA